LRILVVEDNIEISEVMSVFCGANEGIDCQVINSGQEGLDKIRAANFDLILLDLAMSDFSGLDVIKSLNNDGLVQSINIVIFTASSNQLGSVHFTSLPTASGRENRWLNSSTGTSNERGGAIDHGIKFKS
jgi:DNA-binding response OmpR family regulator